MRMPDDPSTVTMEGDAGAAWERAIRRGDWEAAWLISDQVLARLPPQDWTQPRHLQHIWDGRPLTRQRVLVRCYHGLGDTIQSARFVPAVSDIARHVTVWAQPNLLPLLRTMRGMGELRPLHDGVPDVEYDVDVEIMELPHVLRATPDTLPNAVPYLHVSPAELDVSSGALRVGIVWQSGDWDARRSIDCALLAPLAAIPGVRLVVMQYGASPGDWPHGPALWPTAWDLWHYARVIRGLDVLITIDSMPAHLAGALGVPVWTLLAHEADWRWMEQRSDTPWYPTMRLFRQPKPGDWTGVIGDVRAALREFVQEPAVPEERAERSLP